MRHYPTDLLLAVEHVERSLTGGALPELADALRRAGVAEPPSRFDGEQLLLGLDRLLDGVGQYPWQPLTDSDDVMETGPVGTVVLDDREGEGEAPGAGTGAHAAAAAGSGAGPGRGADPAAAPDGPAPGAAAGAAEAVLRGLLLAWALGNEVVVRSARPALWTAVMDALRAAGTPLPAGRVAAPGTPVAGVAVDVPALPEGASLALDCQAPWVHRLLTRRHLPGVTLARARASDAGRDARMAARLRLLTARARRHPYYADLPEVDGVRGLAALPVLEKADLEAHSPPAGRGLCSGGPATGEVLRSGATSGDPRYIVYSRADWDNMVREAVPVLYGMGLEPGDRVINTLFGGGMYGGLTTTFSELSRMPVEAYSTGQFATVDDVLMLTGRFGANVVLGMPALILPLLRDAKERCPGLRIEKVLYGGTPMTRTDRDWLRDALGARVVSSILAANDGAQLGYQCAHLGGTLHHLNDDYNLLEIVDEDGAPLPDGAVGEVLVTTVQKFEGPLVRYRIGDTGRIFDHACPCGVAGRVLEYLGRSDGLIRFKGETVLYGDVLAVLEGRRVSQLQIEVSSEGSKEILTVRTESPVPLDAAEVRELLVAEFPVLGALQDFDAALDVYELRVECHSEGRLARNAVSGKVKTVIDRRLEVAC
ncbi:AMP-dependent synthetase [Streptomyces sp. CC53]|uniref:phenylacetate--CoA ligase family protein n=1 Tax=Streptomyces sp. CC53 TaxID=1906740 RepID=UPI0008DE0F16|nr:phenylacetate--CoA ligase family protein [Streptomyces sp. CC53]OII62932.1 AMP-dependent synthetase [Streptomyces sp. CC53]